MLPEPWAAFLAAVDAALPKPVVLHCIGGFVLTFVYGSPRNTGDIDYIVQIPNDVDIDSLAGKGSALARKHKVYFERVTINQMPENYDERLREMLAGEFKNLRLLAPDPYDLILSKLERAGPKDRDDADYLFKSLQLDAATLRERYQELRVNLGRPTREDLTLDLWLDLFTTN
ncbi:MAG TPA: DUF6036 family nucleotidyltransferase [Candidatus Acidoferrales bacterium]